MTPSTAKLLVLIAAVLGTSSEQCFMKHWQMEYATKARIMPRDTSKVGSCFHECEETESKKCVYTHAWTHENGERHCHTFLREGAVLQQHLVSIKLCGHNFIPRCKGPHCDDCVPCRDQAQIKPFTECGVFPIKLRYSERVRMTLSKHDCLQHCLEDQLCLWVEHYEDTCEVNRLDPSSKEVQEIEVTLLDYRCSN